MKFLNNIGFSHVLQHDVHFDIYQSSFWPSHWRDAPQCDVACRKIEKLFFFPKYKSHLLVLNRENDCKIFGHQDCKD